jgi:hypothetical protein
MKREPSEKEEDEDAKWRRLGVEEAIEEAAMTKKEARARAQAQHVFTDDDEDPIDSSEGDTSSLDASTGTSSSEKVTSRKRVCEEEEDA